VRVRVCACILSSVLKSARQQIIQFGTTRDLTVSSAAFRRYSVSVKFTCVVDNGGSIIGRADVSDWGCGGRPRRDGILDAAGAKFEEGCVRC